MRSYSVDFVAFSECVFDAIEKPSGVSFTDMVYVRLGLASYI